MRLAICWFALSIGFFVFAGFLLMQPFVPLPIVVVLLVAGALAPFEGWYWVKVWMHPERYPWEPKK